MALKLEHKQDKDADKAMFAPLSKSIEHAVKKKKTSGDDDHSHAEDQEKATNVKQQAHAAAEQPQSKASSDAAATLMQHYTEGAMKAEYPKPTPPYLPAKKSKRERADDDHDHGKEAGPEPTKEQSHN